MKGITTDGGWAEYMVAYVMRSQHTFGWVGFSNKAMVKL